MVKPKNAAVTMPAGMSESEVLVIINRIVNLLAASFRFGYFDLDDLKQEGRIFGLEGLARFNPNKGYTLDNFLYRHIRNRYINFKRDNFSRYDSPCPTCPFYDKLCEKSTNQCAAFEDKSECPKWSKWTKTNSAKKNIIQPLELDGGASSSAIADHDYGGIFDKKEIMELIDRKLDARLRGDYQRWLHGTRLNKERKTRVFDEIFKILKENGYEL